MAACSPLQSRSPLRDLRAEACERAATEQVYADAVTRVSQWRKDVLSTANFEAQTGLRDLCHEHEQLKDLKKEVADVHSLVQVASQLQAGGARLSEVMQSSSAANAQRAQVVARMNDDMHATCEKRRRELEQEQSTIVRQKAISDSQHEEALKLLAIYRDRLGLAITREAAQTVRMSFSLIDAKDLQRDFYFTLGLADSDNLAHDRYCVKSCTPAVPELADLLSALNRDIRSSAALPRFVCGMRRAFLKVAKCSQP